jgi:hypothetical protein
MAGRKALACLTAVCLTAAACGDKPPASRPKTVIEQNDSATVVRWARRALGDTLQLRVDALTKGSQGWLVRLVPQAGGTAGGGEVWVERDSSATVVKRY